MDYLILFLLNKLIQTLSLSLSLPLPSLSLLCAIYRQTTLDLKREGDKSVESEDRMTGT